LLELTGRQGFGQAQNALLADNLPMSCLRVVNRKAIAVLVLLQKRGGP